MTLPTTLSILSVCAFSLVLVAGATAQAKDQPRKAESKEQWKPLFSGKDLSGWKVKISGHKVGDNYGNTFRVEDGILKVSYDSYENFDRRFGHLFHEREFAYYKLRVEYRFVGKQVPGGPGWAFRNSGLMLHGQSPESMRLKQDFPTSIEVQLLGGREKGKRPTANLCTPGTHVVMNGKLLKRHCTDSRSKTYRGDRWVTVLVEVRGNSIKHILEGETVLEYSHPQLDEKDADAKRLMEAGVSKMLRRGTISIQSESHPVEFRKIEILELPEAAGWFEPLRDKDLSKHWVTKGNWQLDEARVVTLTPRADEKGWDRFDSYLWLKGTYQDFEIEFDYKVKRGGNSGFYFHVGDPKSPVVTGIEVQIFDSHGKPKDQWLTDHDSGGIIPGLPPTKNMAKPAGSWNHFYIVCKGNDLTVKLNGEVVNQLQLDRPRLANRPRSGSIGFQDHAMPLALRMGVRHRCAAQLVPGIAPTRWVSACGAPVAESGGQLFLPDLASQSQSRGYTGPALEQPLPRPVTRLGASEMSRTKILIVCASLAFFFVFLSFSPSLGAQMNPSYQWTLIDSKIMDEIIGEASGETAWNTIMETGGYNRDRQADEFAGTFRETRYIHDQLRLYGLAGAEIVRFPGRRVWDGIKGELWEVSPKRQKLASFQDLRAMLASGSTTTDVRAELVWVGRGSQDEIERANVAGKIVVTEGSMRRTHRLACSTMGALGVICISNRRPFFDPLQISWGGISSRRGSARRRSSQQEGSQQEGSQQGTFGFNIPPREAEVLKRRLLAGETITVHAEVESTTREYDLEDVVCHIPGTDPGAKEIIFSAHLFEGYTKQGANDNKSGSAGILEVARTLHRLIEGGRIPRPKRTIRFLWGPEFSGTGPWVKKNRDLMEKTICNINMDMVGESLRLNKAFMCLMRTSYGNAHFINDVMENYYRFVGESSRERIQNRSGFYKVPRRIVAPSGPDEPFYYSIETHYGASDHMVFNDWGVQVPGIMMIVWPDQWYHTSGDRVDKADPTQLKRVAIIGAAGAYTVASADDDMAIRIASETTSNATRRLGHQFVIAQERLNTATVENLGDMYRWAMAHVEGTQLAERSTLQSILDVAKDQRRVGKHVEKMCKTVASIAKAHLAALEAHMSAVATRLGTRPVRIQLSALERRAATMVPRQTARVKENGYRGYRDYLSQISADARRKYPYSRRDIANTGELNLLINGKFNVLELKQMLDAQYRRTSDLQAIINYLETLKLAGLIE